MGFFSKIKEGLKKTRDSIAGKVDVMLGSFTKIDEDLFEELEEILILSDVGVNTAQTICEKLRERVKVKRITDPRLVKQQLKEIVSELLEGENEITIDTVPTVILVVGVNGVGKTTTIGKLAHNFKEEGHSVLLGAADTFRAAAIDQLDVWAKDVDDVVYDTEVQKRNTKDLPKRSRLYNSLIDSNLLPPGTASYKPLNDVYVIIITPFDLFGKGLYKYTFNMGCQEAPGIRLEDGATRIFLNTRGKNPEGVNDELIDLLKYFEHSTGDTARNSSSRRIARLHEKISDIKASEEIGVKFMNAWEEKLLDRQDGYEEGKRKGLAEGEEKGLETGRKKGQSQRSREIAVKMKAKGMNLEEIAELTGLKVSEVEKL